MTTNRVAVATSLVILTLAASGAGAQWKNRYPKLVGSNHHVYVEGYELPVLNAGISDPAESPDGQRIAFGSHGWLWVLDRRTGTATRVTSGGSMDSRPAWSPDGRLLAFVRDDGSTLAVVVRTMLTGAERQIDRGFAMDPAFGPDGHSLYYATSTAGGLDLWRTDLTSAEKTRVTTDPGLELRPQPHPDGKRLVYLSKTGAADQIRVRSLTDGTESALISDPILAQMRPALSPDGSAVAYGWPTPTGWELRLVSVDHPGPTILLVNHHNGLPIAPSWSADGRGIYYVEGDKDQRLTLYRIDKAGGVPVEVPVRSWQWGQPTGRVIVHTHLKGSKALAPARLGAIDGNGHPIVPERGQARSDGQNGRVFYYSSGVLELVAPPGPVRISAVQGLATPEVTKQVDVVAGHTSEVDLELEPVWNAQQAGWYSGDHHFHLNFGGQFGLVPEDLLPLLRGENLDVATPLIGNLANRNEHAEFWSWSKMDRAPLVRFGQEVRPSLGHTGLIADKTMFFPWTYGQGTQLYPYDDISNVDPLSHARREGGMGTYMHPVQATGDPFANDQTLAAIPTELVADGVQGTMNAIEVACVWSDEIATAEVWHRLLNLGSAIVPNAGTDVMADFYRTPALGTTRVYVHVDGPFNFTSYIASLKAGRSFVTNGPLVDFRVGGRQPGDVVPSGGSAIPFTLDLRSAVPVDSVAILVNGSVAWHQKVELSGHAQSWSGSVNLPAGGWVAAVAIGPTTREWPAMDSYAYAHTAPVWINRVGSSDPAASRAAARDLLRALAVAEGRITTSYAGAPVPKLREHFAKARAILEAKGGNSLLTPH